jgi:predicted ester cyclase
VINVLRRVLDLRFEVKEILAERDIVASRSTMTATST